MKFTERITDIIRLRSLLIQERGLKCSLKITGQVSSVVAPYTGAWIEIHSHSVNLSNTHVAPYTGAWIEISVHSSIGSALIGRSLYRSVD